MVNARTFWKIGLLQTNVCLSAVSIFFDVDKRLVRENMRALRLLRTFVFRPAPPRANKPTLPFALRVGSLRLRRDGQVV